MGQNPLAPPRLPDPPLQTRRPITTDRSLATFKPARNLRPKLESILAGLTRLGLVTTTARHHTPAR